MTCTVCKKNVRATTNEIGKHICVVDEPKTAKKRPKRKIER